MHDPMTVAFEIRNPWFRRGAWPHRWTFLPHSWRADKHWKDGYRESFVTIWHVDPERDGSDDSCGWSAPKGFTEAEKALLKELADDEVRRPYFFAQPPIHEERTYPRMDDETQTVTYQCYRVSPGDCAALVAELFRIFHWRLAQQWNLPARLLSAAMSLGTAQHDNFQDAFAFWEDDIVRPDRRRQKIERTLYNVLRNYKRLRRSWWQHPRWHVHHWQLQIHPVQAFKRWAFSRCENCGRGFPWGASVCTNSWNGTGPRWFRSEPNVHHADCRNPASHGAVASAAGAP